MSGREEHVQGERERFFGAAKLVASLTMLSRVLGLARDMAIWAFGATRATDAFWTAFSVPNLFRRLFGEGALSAAFVPVFTDVAEREGWDRARVVLANVAGLLGLVLAAVIVVVELGLLVWLVVGRPAHDWQLLAQLTMLMLPFMFTVCLLALASAALNCKGHFAYPAFAPILLNVSLIAGAYVAHRFFSGGDREGLFVLSFSVVVGGGLQLAGVMWLLRSVRLGVVPRLRPVLPAAKRIAKLALPMMIPLGILQFGAFFDRIYAWLMSATPESPALELGGISIAKPLEAGVVTWLYAANRLYQFPLGILAISVATVVFPLFSRYAARNDVEGLRSATSRALRLSLFMAIPAGVGLGLLAEPAVTLICAHGRFVENPNAVPQTAKILQMYCLGMWAYFCNHILLRVFFAQKDTRTPLRLACLLALVNMVLVMTLIFTPLRARAIGLATACTASVNVLLLVWVLQRRWGGLEPREILLSLARTAAGSAVLAGAVLAVCHCLRQSAEGLGPKAGAGLLIAAAVPAGMVAFLAAAMILRCPELRELLRRPSGYEEKPL